MSGLLQHPVLATWQQGVKWCTTCMPKQRTYNRAAPRAHDTIMHVLQRKSYFSEGAPSIL